MIITFLSDFGTNDYFVAAVKGVILSHDPRISLVDITHQIPPHDVAAGAFVLACTAAAFPAGTVHLAVVDPGVGSGRAPLAIRTANHLFVGPDNGIFTYILRRETGFEARRISQPPSGPPPVASTFHARDIFAPAAAALATGTPFDRIGELLPEPVLLDSSENRRLAGGGLQGTIIHVDHFGNCVTSFSRADLGGIELGSVHVAVGGTVISGSPPFYGAARDSLPFLIWGSAGFLEISVNRGSAATRLGIERGATVILRSA